MEISDRVVSDITTIDTQVHALLDAGVDCFVNLLDNTIVGKLESNILPLTNAKKIPVFGSADRPAWYSETAWCRVPFQFFTSVSVSPSGTVSPKVRQTSLL